MTAQSASHSAHRIPYCGYWIEYDPPSIPTWQQHAWQWWHDGAPDAHDTRHGSASSLEDAKREIDEQIAESEDVDAEPEIEPRYCYLCRVTDEDDDADLESAGFPDRYVLVCGYCKCSWQHQTDKREARLAEESDV